MRIQRAAKSSYSRERKMFQKSREAAVRIQAVARGRSPRRTWQRQQRAVTTMQTLWRAVLAKAELSSRQEFRYTNQVDHAFFICLCTRLFLFFCFFCFSSFPKYVLLAMATQVQCGHSTRSPSFSCTTHVPTAPPKHFQNRSCRSELVATCSRSDKDRIRTPGLCGAKGC